MPRTLYDNLERDVEVYNFILEKGGTYREIGKIYGISKQRVRQIKIKIEQMIKDVELENIERPEQWDYLHLPF